MRRWLGGGIALVVVLVGGYFGLTEWQIYHSRDLLRQRRPDVALQWLEQLDSLRPGLPDVAFLQARAYRQLGQLDQARTWIEAAWKRGCPIQQVEREQWLAMAQAGQLAEAEPHLTGMLVNPGDDASEICEAYISGYLRNSQFGKAERLLDGWLADCPDDPQAWFTKGRVTEQLDDVKKSLDAYKRATELDPDRTDIRLFYARALVVLHEYDQADPQFQTLLEQVPDDPEVLSAWARCLLETARTDEARSAWRRILESDSDHIEARIGLGRLEFQEGHNDEALQLLEPVLKTNPKDSEFRYLFGQVLMSCGRPEDARPHLDYASEAQAAMTRVKNLTDEVNKRPDDPELRYEIGTLLLQFGQSADGVGWLLSALEADPGHRATHEALLDHYTREGMTEYSQQHRTALQTLNSADGGGVPESDPSPGGLNQ